MGQPKSAASGLVGASLGLLLACGPPGSSNEAPLPTPSPTLEQLPVTTEAVPAEDLVARLRSSIGVGRLQRSDLNPIEGEPLPYDGYTLRPVSIELAEGFRLSGAIWTPDDGGNGFAAIVAHGHFGEGKSSGEAQGPAHALAAAGFRVLALDTPGVEEGERPNRQIHFEGGAANRERLLEMGLSSMGLQVEGLMAGIDLLHTEGPPKGVVALGASGGAVQSGYLALLDERVSAVVMASYVSTPRGSSEGGCPCDAIPGWDGPDGRLMQQLTQPNLWLSELDPPNRDGVGQRGEVVIVEGEHGFNLEMIASMMSWLGPALEIAPLEPPTSIPNTPSNLLSSESVGEAGIAELRATAP